MYKREHAVDFEPPRIAIVGGGPGGLMTAYNLQQRCSVPCSVTIYEATSRLGGKILTKSFHLAPVSYEAGAAELYDYSHLGEDPLRELVDRLGLTVKPMSGTSVVLDGHTLRNLDDVQRFYGSSTRLALENFDRIARDCITPEQYYDADSRDASSEESDDDSFQDDLDEVRDETAQRFLRVLLHSDLATEPHRTSSSYGLQNYLMNDPAYLSLYTIEGGIERLPQELASRVNATIRLGEPVTRIERLGDNRLRLDSRRGTETSSTLYDYVVVALPQMHILAIEWAGRSLPDAVRRHNIHYDYPASYLRVSILFSRKFWAGLLDDSYMMLDAFGGCCLYDESSRNGCETHGVLGWLLAGDAAVRAANRPDHELIEAMLDTLPPSLHEAKQLFLEGQVHRWIGEVNGMPGGRFPLDLNARHIPLPELANLLFVGDYLFDSTLNGVLDSADFVAETLADAIQQRSSALPGASLSRNAG